MKFAKKVVFFAFLLGLLLVPIARADTLQDIQNRIQEYTQKLAQLGEQKATLQNQIAQFDAQIYLTTLKIQETEEKIKLLGGRIDQLEVSLTALSNAFSQRAVETYKMARVGDPVLLLVSAPNLGEAVSRFHYLERIQEADRDLLQKLQSAQTTYKGQKVDQETLQATLTQQKADLNNQKAAKAYLLQVTQNDEARYQQLLATARAELAVLLGQGSDHFVRDVNEGDTIGQVIPTSSGCSSGQHLHFEIHNGSSVVDPNDYLRAISFTYSYNSDQYGYYGTINPHGSWNWPMNEPIVINQGYGSHGYATTFYAGGVHTGIDMDSSSSPAVKAVKAGKLFAGSYNCGGSFPGTLTYARIEQDGGITTWYLHIIPQ